MSSATRESLGFWSLLSLVIGSQLGAGTLLIPIQIGPYGWPGLLSLIWSTLGASLIAIVFGRLSSRWPEAGGPHVYIEKYLGHTAGYVAAWSYWLVSLVSSVFLVTTAIAAFPGTDALHPILALSLEIFFLMGVIWLNLKGLRIAGNMEIVLTILKIIPILLIPGLALVFGLVDFQSIPWPADSWKAFCQASVGGLWGFIGVESATTPGAQTKKLGQALFLGTAIVGLLYLFGTSIMMGSNALKTPNLSPYTHVISELFGSSRSGYITGFLISLMCFGCLNAWVLTTNQISFAAAQQKLFPSFFLVTNASHASRAGIWIQALLLVVLLVVFRCSTASQRAMSMALEFSVNLFLMLYAMCAFVDLKLSPFRKKGVSLAAFSFCLIALYQQKWLTLLWPVLLPVVGLLLKPWWCPQRKGSVD